MGENTWNNDVSWNTTNLLNYNLYFHPDGSMNLNLPGGILDSLTINYDPHDPSPTVGGPTLLASLDQGPYDQAPVVESRNDLLTFTTAPLSTDVVMRGRPSVHLSVTSDKLDTDFSIRLTDVYPDGRSMLVLDGIRRMRFRNGYAAADTSVIAPGTIYPLDINLFANSAITFLAGHKIRVDISSSNYPRFDCNLNNGQTMYVTGDTLTAVNSVYMSSAYPSYITLQLENFPDVVNEMGEENGIEVFPNPAANQLTVDGKQNTIESVSVYNSVGQQVKSYDISENGIIELNIESLPEGLYILKGETNHKVFTTKICITR
jgi:putative CocE/NonD family hydrolase